MGGQAHVHEAEYPRDEARVAVSEISTATQSAAIFWQRIPDPTKAGEKALLDFGKPASVTARRRSKTFLVFSA